MEKNEPVLTNLPHRAFDSPLTSSVTWHNDRGAQCRSMVQDGTLYRYSGAPWCRMQVSGAQCSPINKLKNWLWCKVVDLFIYSWNLQPRLFNYISTVWFTRASGIILNYSRWSVYHHFSRGFPTFCICNPLSIGDDEQSFFLHPTFGLGVGGS